MRANIYLERDDYTVPESCPEDQSITSFDQLYFQGDKIMSDKHEVVNIFPTHLEAESAVLDLQKAGFDMNKISIIGRDDQTTEHGK